MAAGSGTAARPALTAAVLRFLRRLSMSLLPLAQLVARRKVRARLVPRCRASARDRGNAEKAFSRRVLLEAVGMARIETRIEEANIAPLLSVVYTETSYISSNDRFAAMATELPTAISPTDLIPPHIGLRRRRRRPSQ